MSFQSGFITIIGRPNTGKSTLINQIMGEKLVIISDKPQTTRNVIRVILTGENSQLIFLDTPGMHRPRTKLGEYMVDIANQSLDGVDAVVLITDDLSGRVGPGDRHIIEQLEKVKTPVILAVNKTDTIPKMNLLKVMDAFGKAYNFKDIIPISALTGDGVAQLVSTLREMMPEGPMYFPQDYVTDQPERQIAAEYIREKILQLTRDEVPHGTGVEIMSFEEREDQDMIDIQADIYCERDSHKGMIIGKGGVMLKQIGTKAREDLELLLGCKVNLKLFVKVRENWRNSQSVMNTLGYRK